MEAITETYRIQKMNHYKPNFLSVNIVKNINYLNEMKLN